jgi:type I restriction enzyme S subunit
MRSTIIKSVSDFAEVITGGTPSTRKPEYWDGDIPWLNSGALNDGDIRTASKYITELGLKNSSAKMMPKDSVLVALTGATTGQVGYLTFEASANQSVTGILPSIEHHPRYLYYYLKSQRSKIQGDAFGGAQPHINQKYVKDYKIPLPPLDDQKRIAHLLGKVEGLITRRKHHLKQLDDLLKSVFLEMFGDPVRNEKGWDTFELEKLCAKVIDCPHSTPMYSEEKTGYYCVRSGDIVDGYLDLSETLHVGREIYEERISRYTPQIDDIVYSREGGRLGNAARILRGESICLGQRIMLLRAGEGNNADFLWALLESRAFKAKLQGLVGGGAAPRVNIKDLKKIAVIKPPLDLQSQFSRVAKRIDALKSRYQLSLTDLGNLYGALSQKAFKGELDLSRVVLPAEGPEIAGEEKTDVEEIQAMEPLFELPEPEALAVWQTAEGRKSLLGEWLNGWLAHLGGEPFFVQAFMDAARQRLWVLAEDEAPEWGVVEYDELKAWVFEALAESRLIQGYDDANNRVQLKTAIK